MLPPGAAGQRLQERILAARQQGPAGPAGAASQRAGLTKAIVFTQVMARFVWLELEASMRIPW